MRSAAVTLGLAPPPSAAADVVDVAGGAWFAEARSTGRLDLAEAFGERLQVGGHLADRRAVGRGDDRHLDALRLLRLQLRLLPADQLAGLVELPAELVGVVGLLLLDLPAQPLAVGLQVDLRQALRRRDPLPDPRRARRCRTSGACGPGVGP
jgi:hypothetical protein